VLSVDGLITRDDAAGAGRIARVVLEIVRSVRRAGGKSEDCGDHCKGRSETMRLDEVG